MRNLEKTTIIAMKFYVVFKGHRPGLYTSWDDAREQVEGFPGAIYKSYTSQADASEAWRRSSEIEDTAELRRLVIGASRHNSSDAQNQQEQRRDSFSTNRQPEIPPNYPPEVDRGAWAVDASCLGNPGMMEYRGVEVGTGREIFRVGPYPYGTNNIGEFLALVHAMALMTQKGEFHNIYSDSKTGRSWVRNKRPKTSLKPRPENAKIFELMARASAWLQTHSFPAKLMKWETDQWGEIPADFGRK